MLFHVIFKTRELLVWMQLNKSRWMTERHTDTHTHTHMHFHLCICTILTATVLSLLLQELKIDAFCWNWDDEPMRIAETFPFICIFSWCFMTSYIGWLSFCGMKTDVVPLFALLVLSGWCKNTVTFHKPWTE